MGNVIKLNDKRQRDAVKWVPESLESRRVPESPKLGDGTPDTIEDRIKRIRASLERINVLMAELRKKVEVTTNENDSRI